MKKLISVLFAALLLAAVLPLGAYADSEEKSFTFIFVGKYDAADGSGFKLIADDIGESGWIVGGSSNLVIWDNVKFHPITRIEAVVSAGGENYGDVYIADSGTKQQNGGVLDGSTVTVTDINNAEFYFKSDNDKPVQFSKITVYYTTHEHTYDGNGECFCGVTRGDVEGHDYAYICRRCRREAPSGSASTLSEGNMTIVCTVAGVALGLVGGLLLGRKKKPTAAAEE